DGVTDVIDAETPAGDVHLMDPLVAEVAVAAIPLPVPVVVELGPCERIQRSGTAPHVVIDAGRRAVRTAFANGAAALIAQTARDFDFANLSRLDEFNCLHGPALRAALRAG